jgi:hypothetical protein
MSILVPLSQALYDSQFGTALRESRYAFPIVEGSHLLGLAFSVGLIALTDLRLIGVFLPTEAVAGIVRQLRPWALGGFAATFLSGALLFWAEGARMIGNPLFQAKLLFVLLAGINALYFEVRWGRRARQWGNLPKPPTGVRLAGWTSLILWAAVVIFGRMIPYFG